eukprot:6077813-Pyramimonas_sp.AAC.1
MVKVEGDDSCMCSPGHSQSKAPDGSIVCTKCPKGSAQPAAGQPTCEPCDIGYFSAAEGAAECDACATGSYNPLVGMSSCVSCPLNQVRTKTSNAERNSGGFFYSAV